MEEQLVGFLVEKYHPELVILYGSRARGDSHPLSDWDFLVYTENADIAPPKELFGELIDVDLVGTLTTAQSLIAKYDNALLDMKVLYQKGGALLHVVSEVRNIYARPKFLEPLEVENRKYFLKRRLRKLEASVDNDGVFFFELGIFYEKSIQYWFELMHREWKMNPKQALMVIAGRDDKYYQLLQCLSSHDSNDDKFQSARAICKIICQE